MKIFTTNAKTGIIVGGMLGFLAVLWLIFAPSKGPIYAHHEYGIPFLTIAIALPIIVSGIACGYVVNKLLINASFAKSNIFSGYVTSIKYGCTIGAILFFPVSVFLGTVIGTYIGGAIGGGISNRLGIGNTGIPIGIASGIVILVFIITLIGSLIGGSVLFLISWGLGKMRNATSVLRRRK